ncbi:MAG: biotin--[acetyl-CoA-carboxylase] ligase [Chloroflexi bacterium]|nr:MAG: biotin--[acetyl-CoA-carboxylase] ligase [Chloroflexota bacterium]
MWLDLESLENRLRTQIIGRRLVYLTSTGSTQDIARREAEDGCAEGTIVLAEEQTAGRGRFGRAWVSPPGKNLYFTLVLRPPVSRLRSLTMIAPLAVALAVEEVCGLHAQIKWPNDVILEGRKLAGVLIENELAGEEVRYSLVGTGVNVNFEIPPDSEIADIATSLKAHLGEEVSREAVVASFLNHTEELCRVAIPTVVNSWKSRLQTLGQAVRVTFGNQVHEGVADDADGEGNLLLRRDDGSVVTLEAGEVSLRESR